MDKERINNEFAARYHKALPERIRRYLNERGIPDTLIDLHLLGWNGWRITIPIFTYEGTLAFFRLAKDPEDKTDSPKMLSMLNSYVELYGWEEVKRKPNHLIICEGEFDRLVLKAHGFPAVTSTAGAGTFQEEWAQKIRAIPHVYLCFDRDQAGKRGALKLGRLLPRAKVITLPAEVGEGGDVTDFFVRLKKTRKDFLKLIDEAKPVPQLPTAEVIAPRAAASASSQMRDRINQIKRDIPIAGIVERYVKLRSSGGALMGLCPFHNDTEPSLAVYPKTNTFYCFGCLKHGDVITFVQEMEQVTFSQTLDILDSMRRYHGWSTENHA